MENQSTLVPVWCVSPAQVPMVRNYGQTGDREKIEKMISKEGLDGLITTIQERFLLIGWK